MTKTGTSKDVLTYYHNNWDKIANCYNLDKDNIPIDPAWYRRRLYNNFLDKYYLVLLVRVTYNPKKFFFRVIKSFSLINLFIKN